MCLLFPNAGNCQSETDSVFYSKAINNVKAHYFSTIKEKANLYKGIEYDYFGRGATGTPFFMIDTMQRGSVLYEDFLYEDVPLRYDMVNDVLLVKYWGDNNTVQLIKDKIGYFTILNHQFITLNAIDPERNEPSFYELLYRDNKVLVLARRFKKLIVSSNAEDKSSFVQYNRYFISKDEKVTSVNSRDDLSDIFYDKAAEIKKFLRTRKVKYKKNPEQAILTAAAFYNGLTR
jgi:hypothetical protein